MIELDIYEILSKNPKGFTKTILNPQQNWAPTREGGVQKNFVLSLVVAQEP